MNCCDGADIGGASTRRYEGGCNCGGGQRRVEGRCEPEAPRCQSGMRRDRTPARPTGGCGRPNCPYIVYPASEPPEVEWEYTNYNRKNYKWPLTSMESECPEFQHDIVDEGCQLEENYRSNGSEDDFGIEKIYHDRDHRDRVEDNYYEAYERVGGGCEDSRINNGTYLDHYYEEESVDHQNFDGAPVPTTCRRCHERKRVHF